jgi:hydrogenase maturation protease
MSVLVAGIGNVFLGDDGFGVEVANRLGTAALPAGVAVADYGIRGVHLAYELLDGRYDTLVLVDAVPLGDRPGTVAVLDATRRTVDAAGGTVDAHAMSPDVVLAALHRLGAELERVLVVGCQPEVLDERMGLSAAVADSVDHAVEVVLGLVRDLLEPRRETAALAATVPGASYHRLRDGLQGRPQP